jgi:hypothetical protein
VEVFTEASALKIKDQGPPNVGGESWSNFLRAGRTNSGGKSFTCSFYLYNDLHITIIWVITRGCNMTMWDIRIALIRCH